MNFVLPSMPAGWSPTRLDRVSTVNARIGWKALTASEYVEEGYAFLSTPNIKRNEIDFDSVNYITEFRYDESPELKLRIGDVLLAKDGNTLGTTNVVTQLPRPATVNGSIAVLRPSGMEPRFLRYVLASDLVQGMIASVKAGMGVPHLFQADIKKFPLPLPPAEEQRAIADFLDAETGRIDALIAKKRRLIELLDERYRDLVEVLTGVGASVRVRHLTALITSGPRGWADQVGDVGDPFIRSANLRRESIDLRRENLLRVEAVPTRESLRARVRAGDTVVGITGANTGWVGLVQECDAPAYVSQHVAILRPTGVDPRWLALAVFSRRSQEALLAGQYGGTKQQLGLGDLADLSVHVPSAEEQARLVARLDTARERHERLVSALVRQVDLLVEHRQALITAAVTGEFAVPGVAA